MIIEVKNTYIIIFKRFFNYKLFIIYNFDCIQFCVYMQEKILITGAGGQLGSVLTLKLQEKFGIDHVIATDLYPIHGFSGYFETLDATNYQKLESTVIY